MKKLLLILSFSFLQIPLLLSQTIPTSIGDGSWTDNIWDYNGNTINGLATIKNVPYTGMLVSIDDIVTHNNSANTNTISIGDNQFYLNVYGELNIDILDISQGFTLNIWGKVIINEIDGSNENNIKINVKDGGELIINKVNVKNQFALDVEPNATATINSIDINNNAILTIDGELSLDNITYGNNNDVIGIGIIYYNGTDPLFNDFQGVVIDINTVNFSLPAPYDLTGEEVSKNPFTINLEWKFSLTDENEYNGYEFLYFEIYKNNTETRLYSEFSRIFEIEDITIRSKEDNNNLSLGDIPLYYIRAVYKNNTTNNLEYSKISTFDFYYTPLPISLISFTAHKGTDGINLKWTTATEVNNMGFDIQKLSAKSGNWASIGFVDGHYNHNGLLDYNFTDVHPFPGISYYRLKQMDFDGAFEYFGPVAVNVSESDLSNRLKVYRNQQSIHVLLPDDQEGTIELFDIYGRLIMSQQVSGRFDVPQVKGTYIIRYTNSFETLSTRIVL